LRFLALAIKLIRKACRKQITAVAKLTRQPERLSLLCTPTDLQDHLPVPEASGCRDCPSTVCTKEAVRLRQSNGCSWVFFSYNGHLWPIAIYANKTCIISIDCKSSCRKIPAARFPKRQWVQPLKQVKSHPLMTIQTRNGRDRSWWLISQELRHEMRLESSARNNVGPHRLTCSNPGQVSGTSGSFGGASLVRFVSNRGKRVRTRRLKDSPATLKRGVGSNEELLPRRHAIDLNASVRSVCGQHRPRYRAETPCWTRMAKGKYDQPSGVDFAGGPAQALKTTKQSLTLLSRKSRCRCQLSSNC